MRSELELIKKIEEYLQNELSEADRHAFEQEIEQNPSLRLEVEQQKLLFEGIRTVELKKTIASAANTYWWIGVAKWFAITTLLVGTTVALVYYASTSFPTSTKDLGSNETPQEQLEKDVSQIEEGNPEKEEDTTSIEPNETEEPLIVEGNDEEKGRATPENKTTSAPPITLTINAETFTNFLDKSPANLAYDSYIKKIPDLDAIYPFKESALDIGIGITDREYFIGWTDIGEWVEYQPQITKTAQYELQFFLASNNKDQKREIEYSINGGAPEKLEVPFTGDWDLYKPVSIGTFSFEEGTSPTIRITFKTGWANYKKMVFKEIRE